MKVKNIKLIKIFISIFVILLFTSCSKIILVNEDGTKKYYGINIIDINSSQTPSYLQVQSIGIVNSMNSISLGYIDEEYIYVRKKDCSVIIVTDINESYEKEVVKNLNDICIIRR
jgi:hypothetical protein